MSDAPQPKLAPRKKEAEPPLIRTLRIKVNSLKRTLKDLEYAKKEVSNEQERLDKFKATDMDRVPQQENVLSEARSMVPDAENRIRIAFKDLASFLEKEGKEVDNEELLGEAKAALAQCLFLRTSNAEIIFEQHPRLAALIELVAFFVGAHSLYPFPPPLIVTTLPLMFYWFALTIIISSSFFLLCLFLLNDSPLKATEGACFSPLVRREMDDQKQNPFAAAATSKYPNYIADRDLCQQFFEQFEDASGTKKYAQMCSDVANRIRKSFVVELDDIVAFGQLHLAQRIQMNVLGYMEELQLVIDNLIPATHIVEDLVDQLVMEARTTGERIPPLLSRRYELDIVPIQSATTQIPLRALKGELIGTLTILRGICIAATAIKPKLSMLVSVCEVCAATTFQQVIGDRLTPLQICQSSQCTLNNAVGRLLPQYKASKFVKYQELRVQELPQDVPRGAIPRTIRVVCEGEQTRIASPGQVVRITGVYTPDPSTGQGHEAFKASTMVKTIYKAVHIDLEKRSYQESADDLKAQIEAIREYPDHDTVMEKLTRSIAPEIWGMEDVKKALLCQLVGGSSISNGIKIRSDLNILFMGDPGVAKSQLLKWIASVAPRSVFTTGKGSSGVGLTAAVTRDTHTGEVMLEGGALVLSDRGICCIDEFDKMDDTDRTALHEVMEQQMVSIAKAGIITSLNARTSVLAAANPKFGRWRRNATPTENVNLPPALLSRFDLLWLLLDESNRDRDAELSMHVTHVHLHGVAPGEMTNGGLQGTSSEYYDRDFLRAYIGEVRKLDPTINPAAGKAISDIYCEMRAQSARHSNVVTARSLLSLIRLSQACARLRFSDRVLEVDVREAGRLLDCSKASLQDRAVSDNRNFVTTSDASIFSIIKDIARRRRSVELSEVRPALMVKGIAETQLQRCLRTYSEVGVWNVTGTTIEFSDD
eukprot:gene2111-1287_t